MSCQFGGKENNIVVVFDKTILFIVQIPSHQICFKLRMIMEFEVENLQSAKVEVYDYSRKGNTKKKPKIFKLILILKLRVGMLIFFLYLITRDINCRVRN